MRHRGAQALLAVLALALSATPVLACSLTAGYHEPTNIELVREADVIVLARVVAGPYRKHPGADGETQVVIQPLAALKGALPPGQLRLRGYAYNDDGTPIPLQPTDLSHAHPSVFAGSCSRQTYAVGGLLVAMFRTSPDGLEPLDYPFARQVEDVECPDGTWVRAVRLYVKHLTTNPNLRTAPKLRLARWLAADGDSGDAAIARDLRGLVPNRSRPSEHRP